MRFTNRYGVEAAANLYVPKNARAKLPALVVSGPFGAVKEQSSGLYADAHSRFYSEDVQKTAPESIEVVIVPGPDHVDLHDRKDLTPFDRLVTFFTDNLARPKAPSDRPIPRPACRRALTAEGASSAASEAENTEAVDHPRPGLR
ncbi:alpha/beta hydrolase [Streptomyces bottropensis]|uniref:alpha/beta hydrolase n=1 Tax=Streptomyces bottropensis TaxID=42235 RepID=UPI003829EB44